MGFMLTVQRFLSCSEPSNILIVSLVVTAIAFSEFDWKNVQYPLIFFRTQAPQGLLRETMIINNMLKLGK